MTQGQPALILVVEDDPDIRRVITTTLGKRGYRIASAPDGAAGLAEAQREVPDVIVLDVMMPKLDGWGVLTELRKSAEFAFTPVILLTALGGEDHRVNGFRLGADEFMPKPFKIEELVLRVTRALRQRAQMVYFARGLSRAAADGRTTSAAMSGRLAQFDPLALVCMLHDDRKTGHLVLARADGTGRALLILREGSIVSADIDDVPLEHDAWLDIVVTWRDGEFEFHVDSVKTEGAANSRTADVLAAARKRRVPEPVETLEPLDP